MHKIFVSAALLGLIMPTGGQTADSDSEAIKQTALDYALGWYDGDAARMERSLHADLAKRVLMPDGRSGKGRIEHMSAMKLVQGARGGWGKKTPLDKRKTDVTILDVYGNAACVKLEMHDWIDYMQMSRIGVRWVIVNVLWELTPEAKKRRGIPDKL